MNDYLAGLLVGFCRENLSEDQREILRNHFPEVATHVLVAEPKNGGVPFASHKEAAAAYAAGRQIDAIKIIYAAASPSMGLKEAKEYVDREFGPTVRR